MVVLVVYIAHKLAFENLYCDGVSFHNKSFMGVHTIYRYRWNYKERTNLWVLFVVFFTFFMLYVVFFNHTVLENPKNRKKSKKIENIFFFFWNFNICMSIFLEYCCNVIEWLLNHYQFIKTT